MWRRLPHMKLDLPQSARICYNSLVSVQRELDRLIFEIVLRSWRNPAREGTGQKPARVEVETPEEAMPHRLCDRSSGELWKRIRRPQHVRNISVLGFVAKPLTLHNEKPNTMVRRVAITRRAFFSCFSLRLLAAPATRRDFEGAPLFFSAQRRRHSVRSARKGE